MDNLSQHILITGGGAPGAAGIIQAIKSNSDYTIFACDAAENTAGKLLANNYFTVPMGDDPAYLDVLTEHCLKHKISIVFPLTTKELIPLSKAKEKLAKIGINVIVSDLENLTIANNKGLLYEHLIAHNIPTPQFLKVSTVTDFQHAVQKLDFPNKSIIFKPCIGNGSRGFRIVSPHIDEFDKLFNQKPSNTHISMNQAIEILSKNAFPELLVSEYLPGQEYTVDCLVKDGQSLVIIPRKRIKMNNGISVEGVIENNPEVIQYCSQILNTLKLDGPIGIQVKYSSDNKPLLVEINPRIQGTTVACIGAGINIPQLAIDLKNKPHEIPSNLQDKVVWGTHFIRHYSELFYS